GRRWSAASRRASRARSPRTNDLWVPPQGPTTPTGGAPAGWAESPSTATERSDLPNWVRAVVESPEKSPPIRAAVTPPGAGRNVSGAVEPRECCDHQRLHAGIEGGLDDGGERGGVIDRNVLRDPSRLFGGTVGGWVCAAD